VANEYPIGELVGFRANTERKRTAKGHAFIVARRCAATLAPLPKLIAAPERGSHRMDIFS
jgi:hypothetical protein